MTSVLDGLNLTRPIVQKDGPDLTCATDAKYLIFARAEIHSIYLRGWYPASLARSETHLRSATRGSLSTPSRKVRRNAEI